MVILGFRNDHGYTGFQKQPWLYWVSETTMVILGFRNNHGYTNVLDFRNNHGYTLLQKKTLLYWVSETTVVILGFRNNRGYTGFQKQLWFEKYYLVNLYTQILLSSIWHVYLYYWHHDFMGIINWLLL